MSNQLQHIKDTLSPSDYKLLLEAAKITNGKKIKEGMFINTSMHEYNKVVKLVDPLTEHHDSLVRGTAKNIKAKAKELSHEGFFGGGMFLAK
jgi:hypothetical protein